MSGTDARAGAPKERLWTPANVVTLVRICCVPVFVAAIITPWPTWIPHGATPRRGSRGSRRASSSFWRHGRPGRLLGAQPGRGDDLRQVHGPLADKILVAAALLALVELSVLPSWVVIVILAREFIVSGIRMVAASQGVVIAASWNGKAKTVAQMVAIVLFIVKDGVVITDFSGVVRSPLYLVSWAVMIVALVLTIVSMLDYFSKARGLLGFQPAARGGGRGVAEENGAGGVSASAAGGRERRGSEGAGGAAGVQEARRRGDAGNVPAGGRARGLARAGGGAFRWAPPKA